MTVIKSYTDLPQSKILSKILLLESADMFLALNGTVPVMSKYIDDGLVTADDTAIPCWSLAALLEILAKIANKIDDDGSVNLSSFMGQWSINMFDCPVKVTDNYDNPIDACVEMIIKLKENNLL